MSGSMVTDVNEIAQDLIDAFELTFEGLDQSLSDPLIRWLDYRLRYIEPHPRGIQKSIDFDTRVPSEALPALEAFLKEVQIGADLNPFQTKNIKFNDTSGIKRQLRTDGLWADWKIHHAHLTETPLATGAEFSERSEWLLFFMVLPEHLALIDIRSHKELGVFQSIDLVEKMIRSWPEIAREFKLKGVIRLARTPSTDAQSIRQLRQAGVTQMLEFDGAAYMPLGLGVTTAATSARVTLAHQRVVNLTRCIERFFYCPESILMQAASEKGVESPSLSLAIYPPGRLCIFCKEAELAALFPSQPASDDSCAELQWLLLPPWAGEKLNAYCAAKQAEADAIL